ncbi:MAG TPA: hypothetical protein VI479_04890 [Blastocatellia bacterium]
MPRIMPAGLMEAIASGARMGSHSTLELFVITGAETRSYYFATATLDFGGVRWQPHLRQTDEIVSNMLGDADDAVIELQNVDTILGREFASLERVLYGAEANVGIYWTDLDRGTEWHKVFVKGLVEDVDDNEMTARLIVVADTYSGFSVGPARDTRRRCQAPGYKLFECGSNSPLPACPRKLSDCQQRHPDDDAFARNMGFPFLPNAVRIAIPQ